MATLGYLVKKTSAEVEAAPWGMQFRMAGADAFPYDMLIERVGESGVKWMRVLTHTHHGSGRWGDRRAARHVGRRGGRGRG